MVDNVGQKIKEFREEAGVSQKKLGLSLGLSDKAVSAYESGRTLPPLETLFRIAEELDKPVKFFLVDKTEDNMVEEQLDSIESKLEELLEEIQTVRKNYEKK
jgi:transcriptional regulator with XRE-family HTH domain